jgi:hypothetical protein
MLFPLAYESDEVDQVLAYSAVDSQTRPQPKRTPQRVTKMKIKRHITLQSTWDPRSNGTIRGRETEGTAVGSTTYGVFDRNTVEKMWWE